MMSFGLVNLTQHTFVHTYIHRYISVYTYTCLYMYIYTRRAHRYIVSVLLSSPNTHLYIHIYTRKYMFIRIHVCTYMFTPAGHTGTWVRPCYLHPRHICTYIYPHIHICTYMYTSVDTYIHLKGRLIHGFGLVILTQHRVQQHAVII